MANGNGKSCRGEDKGLRSNGKGKPCRSTATGKASSLHGKGKFHCKFLRLRHRQAPCSVDVNGLAVTRHVPTRGNFGQKERKSLRRSTAKESFRHDKGKFRRSRANFSAHGTASMLLRRCERSGGHTACDGKVESKFVVYRRQGLLSQSFYTHWWRGGD